LDRFAVNHMTVAQAPYTRLLDIAVGVGAFGVEVRNDLASPLFDGMDPTAAGALALSKGQRILALAEVTMFDDWSNTRATEALSLMETAVACGAEAVSLIPRNDGIGIRDGERQANLCQALCELTPMLEEHHLIGLIEPLGFGTASQRHKAEIVIEIEALNAVGRFKLVHDTFHHCLVGGGPIFPEHTGIVHISGVPDPRLSPNQMQDKDRGLVDADDQLDNIGQIKSLLAAGYSGPISFEAFSTDVHQFTNPKAELLRSIHHIESHLNAVAA
jgi:2-keto-myo-inositol isomerase